MLYVIAGATSIDVGARSAMADVTWQILDILWVHSSLTAEMFFLLSVYGTLFVMILT